jgi:hypothetical protein
VTEPILTATKHPVTEAVATHPLATQTGLNLMVHLIEADTVWSGCTKPQRVLLNELCPPAAEKLVREGSLTADDMPLLPDRVPVRSFEAMQRRGLVDDRGRLTGRAIHTWYYKVKFGAAKDKAATT